MSAELAPWLNKEGRLDICSVNIKYQITSINATFVLFATEQHYHVLQARYVQLQCS